MFASPPPLSRHSATKRRAFILHLLEVPAFYGPFGSSRPHSSIFLFPFTAFFFEEGAFVGALACADRASFHTLEELPSTKSVFNLSNRIISVAPLKSAGKSHSRLFSRLKTGRRARVKVVLLGLVWLEPCALMKAPGRRRAH